MDTQLRLLNALKEKRFMRLGGREWIDLDVMLIVSSTHDLLDDVAGEQFSEELYYLLNVVPLMIPPLRDHAEDVPELLKHYVDTLTAQDGILPYPHRTSCVITVGPAIFGNYVTSSNAY
jgi:DNA-binding NtrC family response regulator